MAANNGTGLAAQRLAMGFRHDRGNCREAPFGIIEHTVFR